MNRNYFIKPLSGLLSLLALLTMAISTTAMADTIFWQETGGGTGPWDVEITSNWWTGSSSTTFSNGDDARFHSTIGDEGAVVIDSGGVSPNSILFQSGGGGTWTFTGGDITGAAAITSTAASTLHWNRDGSYTFTGGTNIRGTYNYSPQLSVGGTYHFGSDGSGGGGVVAFTDGGSFNFNPSMAATVDNNFVLSSNSGSITGSANASFNSIVSMGNNLSIDGDADFSGMTLNLSGDRTLTVNGENPNSPPTTKFDGDVNGPTSTFTINSAGPGPNAVTALGGAGGWDVANVQVTGDRRMMFEGDGDTFFDQLNANGGKVTLLTGSRFVKNVTTGSASNGTLNVGYSLQVNSGATVEGDVTNVNSDGVLSGEGNIQTLLNLNNGGVLNPGTGTGTINLEDDLTMNAGSTLLIEADSAASHDAVNLLNTASVTLNNSTLNVTLGYEPTLSDMLFILNSQDDSTPVSGIFAGLTEGSQTTFGNYLARISYLGEADSLSLTGGNDIVLYDFQTVPVPEPSTFLLIGLGLLPSLRKRRRKQSETCSEGV